jgi:hypothetical protein
MKWTLVLVLFGCLAVAKAQADDGYERVWVADAYLELHTGPGRGYPVIQVIERGEWIDILKRKTDWFKVRASNGKEGWSHRTQIEATLTEAGVQKSVRDMLEEDYRRRRVEAGFSAGVLEGDSAMTARVGYRLNENFTAELVLGQASGEYSTTIAYYVALVSQPFSDWRVSPFFSLGLGKYKNTPKATLVGGIETESNLANAALGANYYITRRFYVRGDFRRHVAFIDENRIRSYDEWSLGFGVFLY